MATRKTLFVLLDGIPADVIERVETPNLDLISGEGGYTRAYVGGEVFINGATYDQRITSNRPRTIGLRFRHKFE